MRTKIKCQRSLINYFAGQLSTCCTISSTPNQGLNTLERRARTSSSRRHCSADVHCALLKSSGHGPQLVFTSVTVQVENLRGELRSDPVSALATQCTRTAAATL